MKHILIAALLLLSSYSFSAVQVLIKTSRGDIGVELNDQLAPLSVKNFLAYLETGYYDGTIFHRTIPGFVIQAGGILPDMTEKPTLAPIKNEATNGLSNLRGTISMARTSDIDSATSHFFINTVDNDFLNHNPNGGAQGYGYAVFGKVTAGMDVVDKIRAIPTGTMNGMSDVPKTPVTIKSIKRK